MRIQAESKGTRGGGEREKGGLRGGSSCLHRAGPQLYWTAALNQNPRDLGYQAVPPSHFSWRHWGLQNFGDFSKVPSSTLSTFCLMNDLPRNIKRCFRNSFVSQIINIASRINTSFNCSLVWAPFIWELSHISKNFLVSVTEKMGQTILIQVWFFLFSIYPQLFSASWWNIPEDNLQPHTVDSALMLQTWKAFGMHYLPIKLLLKDENLLLGKVLFTSMSLGIRQWVFITNHKSHLRWQSTEMSLLQLWLCAQCI